MKLWHREGKGGGEAGEGGARLLLIHGLSANADVWIPLEKHLQGRWLAPDLRGHGRSPHAAPYGYALYAADVAELLGQDEEVTIVGHSMGGVVAMALATGWFGIKVRKVIAFGVKIRWAPDEVPKFQSLARSPAKLFDKREDALERYLKVSGLYGLVDPGSPIAASGVREDNGKFRLAADPMTYASTGPDLAPMVKAMKAPLRLGAGSKDPMVNAADMQPFDPNPRIIEDAGHNAQVERPQELWQFIEEELA
ncbi:MAG: alpha/beta hydrolase [Betaproteobacteria bacterium]|nr:alpha/beta hydrolase [Betaproteobacteria bacterium]